MLRFWMCFGLPCGEFGAGALVRGKVESLESLQYGCLKACVGPYAADTISKVGLHAERGVWRIETRHKMGALRLLREIMQGPMDSDLRAVYEAYRTRCEELDWPAGSWCNWLLQALAPGEYQQLLYDWPIGDPRPEISSAALRCSTGVKELIVHRH